MAGPQIVLLVVVCHLVVGAQALSETGKYLVTAPKVIRPGANYRFTVQILAAPSPVNITALFEAQVFNNHSYEYIYRQITFPVFASITPGSVEILTIKIPDILGTTRVRLHVFGTGGLQIEEVTDLHVRRQNAFLFVQTDKAVYSPGDTVMFKTFGFHTKDLTPYTGVYKITLTNNYFRYIDLARWTVLSGLTVNTFTYPLDTGPSVLGDWTIQISNIETGTTVQKFVVEKKESATEAADMELKVHLPKTMNSSTDLTVSFEAAYPGGVAVKGTAEITLLSGRTDIATVQFHGSDTVTFQYTSLLESKTTVKVRVTDEMTGRVKDFKGHVKVYERDVKIQVAEITPAVYKPKFPYTVNLKITNHADEPLHVPADSVYSKVYVYAVGNYERHDPSRPGHRYTGTIPVMGTKFTLPDSGLLPVELNIPEDVTYVNLMVTFQGVQKEITLRQAESGVSDSYLQLSLMGHVPRVTRTQGAEAKFRVMSTQYLTDLIVETVAREQIVSVVHPTLTNRHFSGDVYISEFTIPLTWEMTPVVEVIAYYTVLRSNALSEVVSDGLVINVGSLLDDQITVTSDAHQVTPGQEMTLTVSSRPGASVGILVEESNKGSNQAVTPVSLRSVDQFKGSGYPLGEYRPLTSFTGIAPFERANLILLDGGETFYARSNIPFVETAFKEQLETVYPNNLFFGTNITGPDGVSTFTVTLPNTVKRWSVTGFSFDSSGHWAVTDQPVEIEASYNIYGHLHGPDEVVSGEHIILSALVHNSRNTQSQVTATLRAIDNVQCMSVSADGSLLSTSPQQQQTFTVPAKGSKRVFFTVTSPVGTPLYSSKAHVELTLSGSSGGPSHTSSFSYTISPRGVEQTVTFSDLTRVDGHVTSDLNVPHTYPKEALPQSSASRFTVTERFSDLLLPLVLKEVEMMEGSRGIASMLHFALLTIVAKYQPDVAPQLTTAMTRASQRLLSFQNGWSYILGSDLYSDWEELTMMRTVVEAKKHIFLPDSVVTDVMTRYFSLYQSNDTALNENVLESAGNLMSATALEALFCIAVKDLHTVTSATKMQPKYNLTMYRVNNFLRQACHNPPPDADPLTLSYLALACVTYGFSANGPLTSLMASARHSSDNGADMTFWDSEPNNDNINYLGDWLSERQVVGSADLVTGANALRVLLHAGRTSQAESVARWVFRQHQGNGLFISAWDTVAATEALLVYEQFTGTNASQVQLNTHGNLSQWMDQAPPQHFTASGHGQVYSQVEVRYHTARALGQSPYEVVPVVLDESDQHFKLMVCNRWLLVNESSGVTVQHVTLPSGFQTHSFVGSGSVVQHSTSSFTMYLDQVNTDSRCYTLTADRLYSVAQPAPCYIHTSGYFKPEYQDITAFHPQRLAAIKVCDLCPSCCP